MWWGDRLSDSSRLNQLNWFRAVLKDWNVRIFSPAEVKDSWDTLGAFFLWTCSLTCAPLPFGAVISAWQAFDLGFARLAQERNSRCQPVLPVAVESHGVALTWSIYSVSWMAKDATPSGSPQRVASVFHCGEGPALDGLQASLNQKRWQTRSVSH